MKHIIILLELFWTRDKDPRVPLGHASVLAALRAVPDIIAHSMVRPVNAAHLEIEDLVTDILAQVTRANDAPVDLALGAYTWNEALVRELLPRLRQRGFTGRIIMGGPQISYAGAGLEALYPDADVFIRGYGEQALVEVVRATGTPRFMGVHYAGQPDVCAQAQIDLETQPSPWLTGMVPIEGQRFIRWETQRGCPYACTFCQHQEAGAKLKRRAMSRSRVLAEVAFFCQHGVEEIVILDPIFNVGPMAIEILDAFKTHGFKGRLSVQCRAEAMTDAFLNAIEGLDVKLEFGLQTIHAAESQAIGRGNNMKKVDRVLREIIRRGIPHEISIIYGLPEQTLASFLETVRWCLERNVVVLRAFPLMLLRGTKLDQERDRWALVEDGTEMPIVIASSTFDAHDHQSMAKVSEALKRTEGRHPASLDELLNVAAFCVPDRARFQPVAQQTAA